MDLHFFTHQNFKARRYGKIDQNESWSYSQSFAYGSVGPFLSAICCECGRRRIGGHLQAHKQITDAGGHRRGAKLRPSARIYHDGNGRVLVLIVDANRPKAESLEKMTDEQRAQLFRTMNAYGGTYKFEGKTIEHHIDISANEVWTGTTQIRDIKKEGGKLVYTTRPAPFPSDGKMSVVTLVWEKVK